MTEAATRRRRLSRGALRALAWVAGGAAFAAPEAKTPALRLELFANDLAASRDFYRDVVGLTVGERPPFRRFGYWLYGGEPEQIVS